MATFDVYIYINNEYTYLDTINATSPAQAQQRVLSAWGIMGYKYGDPFVKVELSDNQVLFLDD